MTRDHVENIVERVFDMYAFTVAYNKTKDSLDDFKIESTPQKAKMISLGHRKVDSDSLLNSMKTSANYFILLQNKIKNVTQELSN